MNTYTIYKATNKVNGKSYIGFDSNWPARYKNHKQLHNKTNTVFYQAIRKHGWDNFEWSIVYQSEDKEYTLNVMEEYYIRHFNTHVDEGYGYNMTYGGEGNNKLCEEARYKMGSANRGKKRGPCSDETRKKISAAKKGKSFHTPEQIANLRKLYLGSKRSEECIRKKSANCVAIDPDGKEYRFYNLTRFCRDNNLNQGAMSAVALGKKQHHKGWTVRYV